jgi:hypothetical protein
VPLPISLALAAWLLLVFTATEIWYARGSTAAFPNWTVVLPSDASREQIPDASLNLLGCDNASAATWPASPGGRWQIFYLEWYPARSRTALLAQVHRPEICLPSIGLSESGPRKSISVQVAGFDLVFESMQFHSPQAGDVYVFYCPWEFGPGRAGRNVAFSDATRTNSLLRVWNHERMIGQQVIELILTGEPSREDAEAALVREVGAIVQRAVPSGQARQTAGQ